MCVYHEVCYVAFKIVDLVGPLLVLQHTATHCNALQHTATHCNTLQKNCSKLIAS